MSRRDIEDKLRKSPRYRRQLDRKLGKQGAEAAPEDRQPIYLGTEGERPVGEQSPSEVDERPPDPKRKQAGREETSVERRMRHVLEGLEAAGHISVLVAQAPIIPLADATYTADFSFECGGRAVCVETKGPQTWEDSRIKFKWASVERPSWWFVWFAETKTGVRIEYWHGGKKVRRPLWCPI